jgi:site-specific recombinase XerD
MVPTAGIELLSLHELLIHSVGHSNIATTMRYAHLEKNQVAEKMKAVIDRFND